MTFNTANLLLATGKSAIPDRQVIIWIELFLSAYFTDQSRYLIHIICLKYRRQNVKTKIMTKMGF